MHPAIKDKTCPHCDKQYWVVRWQVMSDGRDAFPYVCRYCNYRSAIVEKHSLVNEALIKLNMHKEDIRYGCGHDASLGL